MREIGSIYDIPLNDIHVDPETNTREDGSLDTSELERAIKVEGQQQPGGVVAATDEEIEKFGKKWILVYGFRRYAVCKKLGLPAYKAVIKQGATKEERLKLTWSENFGRKQLNLWEETLFIKHRVDEGWTEEKIMSEFSLSRGYLQPRAMLAKLSKLHPELIPLAREGKINTTNIRDLNSFTDPIQRKAQVKEMVEKAELNLKIKVKKAGAKTKRDLNTMLMERNKKERKVLLQWAHSQKIPYKGWYKIIAWSNGEIDNNNLLDNFDDMIHDPRYTDEMKDLIDDLESYKDDTDGLYFKLAKLKQVCAEKTYERPINGFPES